MVERARPPRLRGCRPDGSRPGSSAIFPLADLLEGDEDTAATSRLRKGESVGSPIGSESFLAALEAQTQRRLRPPRRGPKPTMIQQDSRRIKCTFTVIRKPVRNLQMTARENYGYIFPKTGLSVRFKIPSVWVAAPR